MMKGHLKKVISLVCISASTWAANWADNCNPQCCAPCANVSIHADLLYWKATGSNIVIDSDAHQFDILYSGNGLSTLDTGVARKAKSLDFDWDLGFKVGVIYERPWSCVSALFDWTHLNTHADGKQSPCSKKGCGGCGKSYTRDYHICADWKLNLDFYDFTLAKRMNCSECFTVTPFFGVRVARIHQKFRSETEAEFILESANGQPFNGGFDYYVDVNEKHKFNGVGPRLGVFLDFDLCSCLHLYGTGAISGILGSSDHKVCDIYEKELFQGVVQVSTKSRQFVPGFTDDFRKIFERDESLNANRWIADFDLGVMWQAVCCDCYSLSFKLGWEYHAIFNQKHAHFGRDFTIDNYTVESFSSQPTTAKQFIPAGDRAPVYTGTCRSTLAVHGLVFSAIVDF